MHPVFKRVRVQIIGIFAIFLITFMAFAVVRPDLLQPRVPAWSITGNVLADQSLFDSYVSTDRKCSESFEPVCGTDGLTYTNFCKAQKAGADLLHQGECLNGWVAE